MTSRVGINMAGRRGIAVLGLTAAIAAGTATAAQAAQSGVVYTNQTKSFSTWFWGRTEVCFQDIGSGSTSMNWWSGTANDSYYLVSGQKVCVTRSFVGLPMNVRVVGPNPVQVTFPIGP